MLTQLQHEILIGLLLGDGNLSIHKNGKNPILRVQRALKDLKYLNHNALIFKEYLTPKGVFIGKNFDKRTNKEYEFCAFYTKASIDLLYYYHKWYSYGVKKIPNDLILTPIIISIWIADDGHIYHGKNHPETLYLKLSTDGFSKSDVDILQIKLNNFFNFEFKINHHTNNQFTICSSKSYNTKKIFQLIDSFFPEGMERKSDLWRSPESKLFYIKKYPKCKWCQSENIYKAGITKNNKTQYFCQDCHKYYIFPYYINNKPSIVTNQCLYCQSKLIVKNGKNKQNKQNYLCKVCKKQFI